MTKKEMTQSQINALIQDSEFEDSDLKTSQIKSRFKAQKSHESEKQEQAYAEQSSDHYGDQEFEDFQQSKRTGGLSKIHANVNKKSRVQKSEVNDSYGNEDFESYEESKRTKEFERSQPNSKFIKKPESKQLQAIEEYSNDKKGKELSTGQTFIKKKQNYLIQEKSSPSKQNQKSKAPLIKTQQIKQTKHTPYNYTRLQERQKQLLFTTLSEQNKKLKQVLAQKDKELSNIKSKYNILLQQKAQVLGNAKETTLRKQLQMLQSKYDTLMKQKAKERAFKTVTANMSKTMTNNFVSQAEAEQRQQQLLNIIQKLKQRLISTDKQLKTLQQKMNEGLDFQDQLQRKLKRVEQLELRLQKMKSQAQEDRALIQNLKQKTKEQKARIQQLQQQKNQLNICLKRAEMTQATQSDLRQQLQQTRREKQLLEKSLKEISLNFTQKLNINSKRKGPAPVQDVIEDSNQLLNYKRK